MTDAPPVPAAGHHLATLGARLRAAGFTPRGLALALGSDGHLVDPATAGDRRRRAARAGALGVLGRILLLGDAVPVAEAAPVGDLGDDLLAAGLVEERDGALRARVLLVPHDDLLVASDRADSGPLRDFVPGVQPPSHLLGCLTVRRPVERALDVGTGCGIQALLLARHAGRVVATDVSERALAFAALNAGLNGIGTIELRAGSLFEPVAGERFGAIAANPPYVISPDAHHTFRDSPLGGEEVARATVAGAADALEPGGHATVLVSWDASGDDPLATPASWLAGRDVDAIVLSTSVVDAERNAERWNVGPDRDEAVERWLAWFRGRGIAAVGYGGVVIRRVAPGGARLRTVPIADRSPAPASAHLLRMLDAPAEGPPGAARVRLVPSVRIVEERAPGPQGLALRSRELVLADGLGFRADIGDEAAAVVARLDGTCPVAQAAPGPDERALVAQLVGLGVAEIVG